MAPVDFQIKWTLAAREDFQDILLFIAADNPEAALNVGDQIEGRIDQLQQFPESGPVFPEEPEGEYRQIVAGNYRVIYRIHHEDRAVEIKRLWHGARGEPEI